MAIRNSLLKWIPHIVWALVISLGYALFAVKVNTQILNETMVSVERYYLKGLCILIPLAIFGESVKQSIRFWQFLMIGVGVIVATFFLSNCIFFTGITAFLWVLRLTTRVEKEDTCFDGVNYFLFPILLIYFLITGFYEEPFLQKMTVYHLLYTLLLVFLYEGLLRFGEYVDLRKDKANMPSKRILDAGTKIFGMVAILVMLCVVPIIKYQYDYIPMSFPEIESTYEEEIVEEKAQEEKSEQMGMQDMFPEQESNPIAELIWEVLERVAFILVYTGIAYHLIKGIYKMIKNFNQIEIEKNDVIESTFLQKDDTVKKLKPKNKFSEWFDFSREMKIRRKYKKMLKKYEPKDWQTPTEMETMAELEIPELHNLYEEVRYGK